MADESDDGCSHGNKIKSSDLENSKHKALDVKKKKNLLLKVTIDNEVIIIMNIHFLNR